MAEFDFDSFTPAPASTNPKANQPNAQADFSFDSFEPTAPTPAPR